MNFCSRAQGWKNTTFFRNKAILLVLLWLFSTNLLNNSFLKPIVFFQVSNVSISILFALVISLISLLSPLAGYMADVWHGRRKTLVYGTYLMILSVFCLLIIGAIFVAKSHDFSINTKVLIALIAVCFMIYLLGNVLFLSNVIQFGTDQLRDSPTCQSVFFVQAYYWTENVCALVASLTITCNLYFSIDAITNTVFFSHVTITMIGFLLLLSILLMFIVLLIVHKKSHSLFQSENHVEDPYKLISKVLCFAIWHNKPIRRSAFTFWENTRPSRLDFGKQRYGGPYSTEQVENVKVLLNILKVVLSLGPFFFLEGTIQHSIFKHSHYNATVDGSTFPYNGTLVPLLPVICMPVFYLALKNLQLVINLPNMFKKIGVAYGIMVISYTIYCVCDFVSFSCHDNVNYYIPCMGSASYYLNHHYFTIPSIYMSVIQQVLFSFSQMLFYPTIYELVCCQSPQHMKGLVFGFFYAWKSFMQLLAAMTVYVLSATHWNSHVMSRSSIYYIIQVFISVLSFIVYAVVARKYRYRKRDDICNYYTFAENYYSYTP